MTELALAIDHLKKSKRDFHVTSTQTELVLNFPMDISSAGYYSEATKNKSYIMPAFLICSSFVTSKANYNMLLV